MAGRGPAPKPGAVRRNAQPESVQLTGDDAVRGPELPSDADWPAATRRWWETWRSSAQAQTFTPTDWDYLLDTALLHAELWAGNGQVAAELRLRVAKFGATPEDRMRLRLSVEAPKAAGVVAKPDGRARKDRLLKAVSGDG